MKEIIEKYLNGKADRNEQIKLLAWLRVKDNRKTFNSQKLAWKKELDNEQLPVGSDHSWNIIQGHYTQNIYDSWQFNKKLSWYFTIAALIFLMIGAGAFAYFYPKLQTTEVITNVIADNGQVSKVLLPDSTLIWLNSGSILAYSNLYATKNRDVKLIGEAYFEVKKNAAIPFTVSSEEIVVKVIGTEFNVNAYPELEKIDVTLISGKVKLGSNRSNSFQYDLSPGEQASYNKLTRKIKVDDVDTERLTSWKEGIVNIYDLSLDELMLRLEKRYNQKFTSQEEVLQFPFTFTIKDESLDEVLDVMTRIAPIKVEQKEGVFEFSLDEKRSR